MGQKLRQDAKRAKRLVQQARQYLKAGDIDRATKLALEAQKLNPESEGAEEVLNIITRKSK